jgi:hypothetical protein
MIREVIQYFLLALLDLRWSYSFKVGTKDRQLPPAPRLLIISMKQKLEDEGDFYSFCKI